MNDTDLRRYVDDRVAEFDLISGDRRRLLATVADYVAERERSGLPIRLTFICTHNSRRSQLAQVWAAVAAGYYGIAGVETFSGGTEVTAFNPRAVAAVQRTGIPVTKTDDGPNPRYLLDGVAGTAPLVCFSKIHDAPPNPTADFCAVMTCTQADAACPLVKDCGLRISLPFDDPKAADDTPEEAAVYDERCREISREMLFLFAMPHA